MVSAFLLNTLSQYESPLNSSCVISTNMSCKLLMLRHQMSLQSECQTTLENDVVEVLDKR